MALSARYRLTALALLALCAAPDALLADIAQTRHNLSITGPGPVKSTSEEELCVFCHVPHQARRDIPYLWNRRDSTANYTPYDSSTMVARVGQPTGASRLCLSCHDGTVALGALLNRSGEVEFAGGIRFMPQGGSRVGTDLSTHHPVSFVYDQALAASNQELVLPGNLPPEVKLDGNDELQCTACHDPHRDEFGKFLVLDPQFSALCTACHEPAGWQGSSHALSGREWNGMDTDPWQGSGYATVAENGCQGCHVPHAAGSPQRLLRHAFEEDNCLGCHNGNVARNDIGAELVKRYGHFVQNYVGLHDPAERPDFPGMPAHVECADCHNPHQANGLPSPGLPLVAGANQGAAGIDLGGQHVPAAANTYEICFQCHADNNVISSVPISRQVPQLNTRLQFDPSSPSFHPVAAAGVNRNVPSLLPPYTVDSLVGCTDCHGNDDPAGPRGPHGSEHEYLLVRNYTTRDLTIESPYEYELCYGCHSRASILSDQSFPGHNLHIVAERAPCSACHDPHGISAADGSALNHSHLINFDLAIVFPDSQGRLQYEYTGVGEGTCYLSCHGAEHAGSAP